MDGDSEVDPFDFKTLIPHDADASLLTALFEKLPNSTNIIERVSELLRENQTGGAYVIPKSENAISELETISLAKRYAVSLKEQLRISGHLDVAAEIDPDKISVIRDNKEFLRLSGDSDQGISEALEELRLLVRAKTKTFTKGSFALNEALLGLTNYPQISYYILSPALKIELDTRAYYELWRGGGDIAFFKGRILVLAPK